MVHTIGNFNQNTLIELQGNKLTRIESDVFQEILRNGGTIDVKESKQKSKLLRRYLTLLRLSIHYLLLDPFNCEQDPCHLAWIFNGDLLNLVKNAKCSNGTFFKDLDLNFFADYCNVYDPISIYLEK